jgi:hypothetical protein
MIIEYEDFKYDADTYAGAWALIFKQSYEELTIIDSDTAWWMTNCIFGDFINLVKIDEKEINWTKEEVIEMFKNDVDFKARLDLMYKDWWFRNEIVYESVLSKTTNLYEKDWLVDDYWGSDPDPGPDKQIHVKECEDSYEKWVSRRNLIRSQPKVIELMDELVKIVSNKSYNKLKEHPKTD